MVSRSRRRSRIYLTVRDSAGLTHMTFRDVLPRKVQLTLATSPAALQLRLDGQPVATPISDLPDVARLGRPHAHDLPGRPAAQGAAHAGDQPGGAPAPPGWSAGRDADLGSP